MDVSTAFLQSFKIKRNVYIRPPPEADTNKIWHLLKPVYGLTDSSRLWYLTIRNKLIELGLEVSPHDQGLFYLHTDNLSAIIILFVDDLLVTGKEEIVKAIKSSIKEMFVIGSEATESFRYLGMKISQAGDMSISLDQKEYVNSITPITTENITKKHKDDDAPPQQKDQLRSLIGKFNWLVSVSRPDIAYETRVLSTILNNPQMKHLYRANKMLKHVQAENITIQFPSLDLKQLQLLVFADASFANLPNGGSQGAFIIFLSDLKSCCPLTWNSLQTKEGSQIHTRCRDLDSW